MRISKRILAKLDKVYSIALIPSISIGNLPAFAAGSEVDSELLLFEPPDYESKIIANSPGGFMSLWPLQKMNKNYIVASTNFKPIFDASGCRIIIYPLGQTPLQEPIEVARLPYTHRIAIHKVGNKICFLGSTLCRRKDFTQDWEHPGGIYLAILPDDVEQPWAVKQIVFGLSKNHGMDYIRLGQGSKGKFLISAMEGLYYLHIPKNPEDNWKLERISEGEHSDAFAFDWNGSGNSEIFTISPFHGNILSVYQKVENFWKRSVIDDTLEMGHVLWAGNFLGEPALVIGNRQGRKELKLYRFPKGLNGSFKTEIIDQGIGPTQMAVVTLTDNEEMVILAGHAASEVIVYNIFK